MLLKQGILKECSSGWTKCSDRKQCVPEASVCDGVENCVDKSDEADCVSTPETSKKPPTEASTETKKEPPSQTPTPEPRAKPTTEDSTDALKQDTTEHLTETTPETTQETSRQNTTIQFSATPAEVKLGVTEKLTLLCQLNDATLTGGNVRVRRRDVTSHSRDKTGGHEMADEVTREITTTSDFIYDTHTISITRNNEEKVAEITELDPAPKQYTAEKAEVTGDLLGGPGSGVIGYLKVVFNRPKEQTAGHFRCRIYANSADSGRTVIFSSSAAVAVARQPTIQDLVARVNQLEQYEITEFDALDKENAELWLKMKKLNDDASEMNEILEKTKHKASIMSKTLLKLNNSCNCSTISTTLTNQVNTLSDDLHNTISSMNNLDQTLTNSINNVHTDLNKAIGKDNTYKQRTTEYTNNITRSLSNALDKVKNTQTGYVDCTSPELQSGGNTTRFRRATVAFPKPYQSKPTVFLSVMRIIGLHPGSDTFHSIAVNDVNLTHLSVLCFVWGDSQVKQFHVGWLSLATQYESLEP